MKNLFLFLFLLVVFTSKAQDNRVSGLNSRQFTKYWKVESESPDYKVTFQGDTAEIVSPKGLTLWRKEKMSGKVTIEYDACVVAAAGHEHAGAHPRAVGDVIVFDGCVVHNMIPVLYKEMEACRCSPSGENTFGAARRPLQT